jgi:hypothetical protein
MNQRLFPLGALFGSAAVADAFAEEFVFGWKPGLSCRVHNSMQKGPGARVTLSYTLNTTAGPGGYLEPAARVTASSS